MSNAALESTGPSDSAAEKQWWLARQGVADGPHSCAYITASLRTKTLAPETLACLVGAQEWKPLTDWPDFGYTPAPQPPPIPPQSRPATISGNPFTNPALPSMANWLCVYCLLWRPVVSVFGLLNTFDAPASWFVVPSTSIFLTTSFLIGGVLLRNGRRHGATIVKVTLWVALGLTLFFILVVFAVAAANQANASGTAAPSTPAVQSAAESLMGLLWLFEIVFQIVAVIWLHRNDGLLPNVGR
ncbi:MAG TPA: hypothetical protein VFG04_02840 [Planctomycetaceae bacterium]|jgi:hypothetical protein|nr:hypothetical protein [Planctomycetaceae bacterium]